jgi:hypothetical protein
VRWGWADGLCIDYTTTLICIAAQYSSWTSYIIASAAPQGVGAFALGIHCEKNPCSRSTQVKPAAQTVAPVQLRGCVRLADDGVERNETHSRPPHWPQPGSGNCVVVVVELAVVVVTMVEVGAVVEVWVLVEEAVMGRHCDS